MSVLAKSIQGSLKVLGFKEKATKTELPDELEDRLKLALRGRAGTNLTRGDLSQVTEPTAKSALLGGTK